MDLAESKVAQRAIYQPGASSIEGLPTALQMFHAHPPVMEAVLDELRERILQDVSKADLEAAVRVLQAFDNIDVTQTGALEKEIEAAS